MQFFDSHVHIGDSEKIFRSYSLLEYLEFSKLQKVDALIAMPNVSNFIPIVKANAALVQEYFTLRREERQKVYIFALFDKHLSVDSFFEQEWSGLKYHPSISQLVASNKGLYKFYEFAEIKNIPVLVHCGRNSKSHISHVVTIARNFPRVNFIAAHLGGGASDLVDSAISLVSDCKMKNIYFDTSAVKLPWLIERAVTRLGDDRVLFGSDEPYSDLRIAKYCLELTSLGSLSKEKVAHLNIKSLLA